MTDDPAIIFRAIEFAARAHRGQFRKGTRLPYLIHPLGVARVLIEAGASEQVVAAGVLHDTVEDAGVTLDEISREFGPAVAALVAGASEPDKSAAWEDRKERAINAMAHACVDELMVEAADKLDNIRAIREDREKQGDRMFERFRRGKERQAWYYSSLARGLQRRACDDQALAAIVRAFTEEVEKVFGPSDPASA